MRLDPPSLLAFFLTRWLWPRRSTGMHLLLVPECVEVHGERCRELLRCPGNVPHVLGACGEHQVAVGVDVRPRFVHVVHAMRLRRALPFVLVLRAGILSCRVRDRVGGAGACVAGGVGSRLLKFGTTLPLLLSVFLGYGCHFVPLASPLVYSFLMKEDRLGKCGHGPRERV